MTKILKIDYSPYKLKAKHHPNSRTNHIERNGVLIRFLFKDDGFGYADCHPWEEFGDEPLAYQLKLLKEKKFTYLTQRSAYFAKIDASFRSQDLSAFSTILPIKNHYTSPSLVNKEEILKRKNEGFEKIKFKFGNHIPNEINYLKDNFKFFLNNKIKIRIDYNGNLKKPEILDNLVEYKEIIDFIEDPFLFQSNETKLNEEYLKALEKYKSDLNFAVDFIRIPNANLNKDNSENLKKSLQISDLFAYKVIKPVRENYVKLVSQYPRQKFIFTSAMDHPLGQVSALYEATLFKTTEHCGLLTHHLYEPNEYAEALQIKDTILSPYGRGLGFDALLTKEKWKNVFK